MRKSTTVLLTVLWPCLLWGQPDEPSRIYRGHAGAVWAAKFLDGKHVVSAGADRVVHLWNIRNGKIKTRFAEHRGAIRWLDVSADRKWVATASDDRSFAVWNVKNGKPAHQFTFPVEGDAVAFSPDASSLLGAGFQGHSHVWSLKDGQSTKFGHKRNVGAYAVAFSQDGKFAVTGGNQKFMVLWETKHWTEVKRFTGENVKSYGLVFSPDNRYLISAQPDKPSPRLWHVPSGRAVHDFSGHKGGTFCVAISPDGQLIASGGGNGDVALWDLETRKEVRRVTAHDHVVRSVDFSPDGKMLLTASVDGTCKLWRLSEEPARESGEKRDGEKKKK